MPYIGKSPEFGVRQRYYYTATGSETSLSGTDDNGLTLAFSDGTYVDVMLNGVTLVAGTDYNTLTANTISGLAALSASDIVEIVVYDVFSVANTVPSTGGTYTGAVSYSAATTYNGAITATGGITNLIRTQVFTASGTYTPSTNATKAIVHVVGAGGGGGGTPGTALGEAAAAGGGGAGGVIISDVIDVSGGSYTSTITIGAAGVGANDTAGTDGGDTSYADGTITLTAGGGGGGVRQADTASFKNASGGSGSANTVSGHTPIVNTKGESGYTGLTFADADISNMVISGAGGSAYPYGSGGEERQRTTTGHSNGQDASGYGGGGGGALSHSTTGARAGGDGTDGVVIVFEYL